jgi:hypothetical protein
MSEGVPFDAYPKLRRVDGAVTDLSVRRAHDALGQLSDYLESGEGVTLLARCVRLRNPRSDWLVLTDQPRLLLVERHRGVTFDAAPGRVVLEPKGWAKLEVQDGGRSFDCPTATPDTRSALLEIWSALGPTEADIRIGEEAATAVAGSVEADDASVDEVSDEPAPSASQSGDAGGHRIGEADPGEELTRVELVVDPGWAAKAVLWAAVTLAGILVSLAGLDAIDRASVLIEGVPLRHTPIIERPVSAVLISYVASFGGIIIAWRGALGVRKAFESRHGELVEVEADRRDRPPAATMSDEQKTVLPLTMGVVAWPLAWAALAAISSLPAWQVISLALLTALCVTAVAGFVMRTRQTGLHLRALLVFGAVAIGAGALFDHWR